MPFLLPERGRCRDKNDSILRNSDLGIQKPFPETSQIIIFVCVCLALSWQRPTHRCPDSYTGKHTVHRSTGTHTHSYMLTHTSPPEGKFKVSKALTGVAQVVGASPKAKGRWLGSESGNVPCLQVQPPSGCIRGN